MPNGIAVVVITWSEEDVILRTLQHVEQAVNYYLEREADRAEVVVVNDGSPDRSREIIDWFISGKPGWLAVHHPTAQHRCSARNQGAWRTTGEILFFIDGDDLVYPWHFWVAYKLFQASEQPLAGNLSVQTDSGTTDIEFTGFSEPLGVIRTGVDLDDQIDPGWYRALTNTIPLNMAVRRCCHQFIEGWPAYLAFHIGYEDCAYSYWCGKLFKIAAVEFKTVRYMRYPGTTLDQQILSGKFLTPQDQWVEPSPPKDKLPYLELIRDVELSHMAYLRKKLRLFGPPVTPTGRPVALANQATRL